MRTFAFMAATVAGWLCGGWIRSGSEARVRELVVGLPCEGCGAVFVGLPETLALTARLVGDSTDYMPSWSPEGRRIVFASTRSGSHDLYLGSSDRADVTRVTAKEACHNTEPRWSPDGQWIAYRSECDGNREIHRIRPDGSDRQRLTRHPAAESEPSWSPDGRRLRFTSQRDDHPEVYVMNSDGSDTVRLTWTMGGQSRRAEWSRDGEWIAFGTSRDGDEEIYVMRSDGSAPQNVSRHPAREYYSRWSPDGLRLVFTSNRDRQRNAIYSCNIDGSDVRRLFPR